MQGFFSYSLNFEARIVMAKSDFVIQVIRRAVLPPLT